MVSVLGVVLLLVVVVGAVVGLWQLALPATAALGALSLVWTRARFNDVTAVVRAAREDLQKARGRETEMTGRVDALSEALSSLPERLEALHSEMADSRAEVAAGLRSVDERVAGNSRITQALEATRADLGQQQARMTEQGHELDQQRHGLDQQRHGLDQQRHGLDQQRKHSAEQRQLLENLLVVARQTSVQAAETKQQLDRSVRRQVEMYGLLELVEGKFIARLDQFVDESHRELRRNRLQISALSQQLDQQSVGPAPSGVTQFVTEDKFDVSRYLYFLSHHVPKEVEALQQLQRTLDPIGFTPLLGGWALSPSGMLDIVTTIQRDKPGVVVECGSGSSTVWLALALRANGAGHLYSLEHDPTFAESTRGRLAEQGLTEFVTVLDAPIVDHATEEGTRTWYAVDGLVGVENIDLLVVDGPPQALGNLRGGALALLRKRLADGSHVFFDDVNRAEEHDTVGSFVDQFSEFRSEPSPTPVQAHLTWQIADGR